MRIYWPIILLVLTCVPRLARADGPASAPVDKSAYNLLYPTPIADLRGMSTDRPNVTNTPNTIDAGHLQIETGIVDYRYYRDHARAADVREDDLTFGQPNFRLGVTNNLEINIAINAYENDRTHDYVRGTVTRDAGYSDTTVGGKMNIWGNEINNDPWKTALAIQPQLKFPTARDGLGNRRFESEIAAPFLLNLPAAFHLGVQPGVSYERSTADTGYVTGWENAVSLDRVVITNLDLYVEYASDVTTEKHVEARQMIDVGGVYALTDNVVLDAGVNFGLNHASINIESVAGISVRF